MSGELNGKIVAPFGATQVQALNEFQQAGFIHPFTCGWRDNHPENEGVLIADEEGWHCPVEDCGYTQDWAHGFMGDLGAVRSNKQVYEGYFGVGDTR